MIDNAGKKWACQACIRGHRVTNCTHSDRELTEVKPKGRPPVQCPHCRTSRKIRATHIKCDCGAIPEELDEDGILSTKIDHHEGCACNTGSLCSCTPRSELATPPEEKEKKSCKTGARPTKPRLPSKTSESCVSTLINGQHKPIHHKNHDLSQERGKPYPLRRPNSVHGPTLSGSQLRVAMENTSGHLDLALGLPLPSTSISINHQRGARSEHGSPNLNPEQGFDIPDYGFPPLDAPFSTDQFDTTDELTAPISTSLGYANGGPDWADYNFPVGPQQPQTNGFSRAESYTSYDNAFYNIRPEMTRSSSGIVSDAGRLVDNSFRPSFTSQDLSGPYLNMFNTKSMPHLPTTTYQADSPPATVCAGTIDNGLAEEWDFTLASPLALEQPNESHNEAFVQHGISVNMAQSMAHPGNLADSETEAKPTSSIPLAEYAARNLDDPVWATSFYSEPTNDDNDDR